jgi:integrase
MECETREMKPNKPEGSPLFPHSAGKWAKKIGGKLRYFGRWDDYPSALAEYQQFMAPPEEVLTLRRACNLFLSAKDAKVKGGELAPRSFKEYHDTCKRFIAFAGGETPVAALAPDVFSAFKNARAERWYLVAVGNEVTRIRSMFKWLFEAREIADPMHFGPDFKRPSAKSVRRHKRLQGKRMFSPEQIHLLLDECGLQLRSMVLLGVNCGFGNTDCALLPLDALKDGWIDFPRPKTEVDRLIPLWPETLEAIEDWLARRYKPEGHNGLFVLPGGRSWDHPGNPIAKQVNQAIRRAGVGGSFYSLRRTFRTVADGSKDQVAVNAIMGHVDPSMGAVYRQGIAPERLMAVTTYVRQWLWG